MKEKNQRLIILDYLRGLAAIGVVLFHFTFGYDNGLKILNDQNLYFTYGRLGVHLFFMISGFVIFMTLENTKNSLDFFISRFSRLYPAYWGAILITCLFVLFIPSPFHYNDFSFNQVVFNLTMFQHWFKVKDLDGAYWTLSVELTFYFLMWFLFYFNSLSKIYWYCMGWLSLSTLVHFFPVPFENYLNQIFILPYCPLFVAGIVFYLIKKDGNSIDKIILLLCSLALELTIITVPTKSDSLIVTYCVIVSFYIIFYLISINLLNPKYNRFLSFFGTISYTLYLIHENIGMTAIFWLKQINSSQFFYIPVAFLIVIVIAFMLSYFIERPMMKMIKARYSNYKLAVK